MKKLIKKYKFPVLFAVMIAGVCYEAGVFTGVVFVCYSSVLYRLKKELRAKNPAESKKADEKKEEVCDCDDCRLERGEEVRGLRKGGYTGDSKDSDRLKAREEIISRDRLNFGKNVDIQIIKGGDVPEGVLKALKEMADMVQSKEDFIKVDFRPMQEIAEEVDGVKTFERLEEIREELNKKKKKYSLVHLEFLYEHLKNKHSELDAIWQRVKLADIEDLCEKLEVIGITVNPYMFESKTRKTFFDKMQEGLVEL